MNIKALLSSIGIIIIMLCTNASILNKSQQIDTNQIVYVYYQEKKEEIKPQITQNNEDIEISDSDMQNVLDQCEETQQILMETEPECIYIERIPIEIYQVSQTQIKMLAQLVFGQAGIVKSMQQRAAVVWVVLNRLDANFENTIAQVITAPYQFAGYDCNNPIKEEYLELVNDVISRWKMQKNGIIDVGRIIPNNYYWFESDFKGKNIFKDNWIMSKANIWDFSMQNPYQN